MGMDINGIDPTTRAGHYFRNSIWWWGPLAEYILAVAPAEITNQCDSWHTNDGDGLDGNNSLLLAAVLRREIETGRTAAYAAKGQAEHYGFDVDNVAAFCSFLEGCGGFAIY